MEQKKEVKSSSLAVSEPILLEGEKVMYHNGDLIITNRRVIKHKTGKFSKFSELFAEDYQDMDISRIVSVKIEEKIHTGLVKAGMVVLLVIPLLLVASQIEFLTGRFPDFSYPAAKASSILLLISMIFFVFSFISKNKVLSIFGEGGVHMDFDDYVHEDLLKIRKYQYSTKI